MSRKLIPVEDLAETDYDDDTFNKLVTAVAEASSTATDSGIPFDCVIERAYPNAVVISRFEYADLTRRLEKAEEDEDRRDAEAATGGAGDYLPAALVDRMIAGESPIRIFREHRDMKQEKLAAAAGIGKSFLSQVENGSKEPSVNTLKALAEALDVTLDDLV